MVIGHEDRSRGGLPARFLHQRSGAAPADWQAVFAQLMRHTWAAVGAVEQRNDERM
jgi:hypothetical protein